MREQCKVIYSYKPANEDELELKEGDIITILNKDLPDKGWWKGELKGKVGVFPDNFVHVIASEGESIQFNLVTKKLYTIEYLTFTTYFLLKLIISGSPQKDHINHTPERPPSTTKLLINNNSNNIGKKMDNFGSRDSLNESSNIPTGNVAAFRKSLENKCNENHPVQARRTPIETKSTAEIRKSLENLDDRKSTPPPLTKKPIVPMKKSPTVGSVAGNIFSGLKQKVKSVEQKMTHHDSLDGVGSSKTNAGHVADNNEKGISGERLHRDESEFDQVERNSSILPDMRAQRAKAPKRRLPSSNSSSLGDSISYQNGDSPTPTSPTLISAESSFNKSEEDLTKPKQREWEKNKAPWMDELKASQAKKTSPGIEMRTPEADNSDHKANIAAAATANAAITTTTTHNNSFNNSHKKNEINTFEVRSSSVDIKSSDFHSNAIKKEASDGGGGGGMAKSLSSLATKISILDSSSSAVSDESATNNGVGIKVSEILECSIFSFIRILF